MPDPKLLEELRAVFFDELAEWLGTLEREVVVLRRPGTGPDELRRAVLEIRRAAHTLKGAARVVGHRDVEQLCHGLESELPRAEEPLDLEAVRRASERALAELQAWSARHAAPPPEPAPGPAPEPPAPPAPAEPGTVRVASARVAEISQLAEELLVVAGRGRQELAGPDGLARLIAETREAVDALARAPSSERLAAARAAVDRLGAWSLARRQEERRHWTEVATKASALTVGTRALRAVRVDTIRATLERAVLETAQDVGKQAELSFVGGEAQLDRRVVEQLREPMVHLMRNAVDHGIEPPEERARLGKPAAGRIVVEARAVGTEVVLTVTDDGRGVDLAGLRRAVADGRSVPDDAALADLLFEPGVTTRRAVTETSGRGIGLDVVRQRVSELQGRVRLEPRPGEGARFTIVVPGDLSVARGLVVRVRGRAYVLVESAVERGVRLRRDDLRLLEGRSYVVHEGETLPLVDAARVLGLPAAHDPSSEAEADSRSAVILSFADRRLVLAVDAIGDVREVVIKPLGPRVRRAAFVTGATTLPDGELACVLDPDALARHGRAGAQREEAPRKEPPTVLVADDSVTTRQLLVAILQTAGYRVETASDGEQAWRRMLGARPPAIVVSDIEMPFVDGFQLLARIKSSPRTSTVPVVLVTALASDDDRRRALELGADAYVVKGRFDQAALLDTIAELLP